MKPGLHEIIVANQAGNLLEMADKYGTNIQTD